MDRLSWRLPRGTGLLAAAFVIFASTSYGVVKGGHIPTLLTVLASARDAVANQAGFRVKGVAITGNTHMSREEILATAGITGSNVNQMKSMELKDGKKHG